MRSLSKAEIAEVVAFDRDARMRGAYDARRYGSVTDVSAIPEARGLNFGVANIRGGWGLPCHLAYSQAAAAQDERKPSAMPTRKTLRYNYVDVLPGKDGSRDVDIVHVAVRLDRSCNPVVKEVARISVGKGLLSYRDIGYHGLGGYVVYWNRQDYDTKSIGAWNCPPALGRWVTEKLGRSSSMTFPWHQTVNPGALKATRYRYSQFEDGHDVGIVDWLRLYREEPRVEALAKAGLHVLISLAALNALKDRRVFAWVRSHADEVRRGANVREILWACRRGCSLSEARSHFEFVDDMKRILRGRYDACRDVRLDYVRLEKLVGKLGVKRWEYGRYLHECARAGLDLRNEGTLYPPASGGRAAFIERIERIEREGDRLERNAARRRARADAKRAKEEARRAAEMLKRRLPELEAFQRSADRVLDMSGLGYRLVVAKSQEELLAEGKRMGNCVGCGTYGRGIVDGRCLIVMVRDAKGRPYCDIEIERGAWTVRQCYARMNQPAPEDVHKLAESLAQTFKADSSRRSRRAEREAS